MLLGIEKVATYMTPLSRRLIRTSLFSLELGDRQNIGTDSFETWLFTCVGGYSEALDVSWRWIFRILKLDQTAAACARAIWCPRTSLMSCPRVSSKSWRLSWTGCRWCCDDVLNPLEVFSRRVRCGNSISWICKTFCSYMVGKQHMFQYGQYMSIHSHKMSKDLEDSY